MSHLPYTAGLIDGEGTITLSKLNSGEFRSPVISISSTSYELLEFLKTNYGGSISKHKVYKNHHKQSWSWKIVNDRAVELCTNLLPFLLEKSKLKRCKLISKFYKKLTPRNGKYPDELTKKKRQFEQLFFSS
jgi:hypothetical protein